MLADSAPPESGRQRDPAVAGGLVDAEREAASFGPSEVDLHHHRHGPREPLIDAEQRVGGDDPPPAGRYRDQHRDRHRDRPARDQQPPPPCARRGRSRGEVRRRLRDAKGDNERQERRARTHAEVLPPDKRQRRALEPDHRADERVDRDQQRELRGSTTANALCVLHPNRYDAHAVSSFSSWRKYTSASGRSSSSA
jgi:hypothetical protein